jgi:hypothetical protein
MLQCNLAIHPKFSASVMAIPFELRRNNFELYSLPSEFKKQCQRVVSVNLRLAFRCIKNTTGLPI